LNRDVVDVKQLYQDPFTASVKQQEVKIEVTNTK